MKISVGISNHHVHLTKNDLNLLFGIGSLSIRNYLNQPDQFASNEKVSIEGPKGRIDNVTIVGPLREYTQVEISRTDSYKLGINPPVRDSGDLKDASLIKIIGPCGIIEKTCGIIANRHIHINKQIREEKGLIGVKEVRLKINGLKGGILEHVYLKDSEKAYFEVHLDNDDANAFLLNSGDEIEIL